jgi:hypothetical protein
VVGPAPAAAAGAVVTLFEFGPELAKLHQPVLRELQSVIDRLAGHSFGSLEASQLVASEVQRLMTMLGQKAVCPREGCGLPASLVCDAHHRPIGYFSFVHRGPPRGTHLGSTLFPAFRLTAAAPDRRTRAAKAGRAAP